MYVFVVINNLLSKVKIYIILIYYLLCMFECDYVIIKLSKCLCNSEN